MDGSKMISKQNIENIDWFLLAILNEVQAEREGLNRELFHFLKEF